MVGTVGTIFDTHKAQVDPLRRSARGSALNPASLRDLIPEPYWAWLSHDRLDAGLPEFRSPGSRPKWLALALDIERWWSEERREGRHRTITADVLLHRILTVARAVDLNAAAGVIERIGDTRTVEWVTASTRLHIDWPPAPAEQASAAQARDMIRRVASQMWSTAEDAAATKVHVVAASRSVRESLYDVVVAQHASTEPGWVTLGLTEAHRLGLDALLPDIHVQLLHRAGESLFDWYLVQ